ncbi:MAG: metal ABC transporter ATP-binding protein [Phycisphaerae bacterium]
MAHGRQAQYASVGPDHVGGDILCMDDVSFRYADGMEALHAVTLHVQEGSTLGIVGPNGAGKTTLLKILLGLLEGYQGTVAVAGMAPADARRRGGVVSWVPQQARMAWDFPVTVENVVRMGLVGKTGMFRMHSRADVQYVREIMGEMGIDSIADRPIGQVSGGQQQRAIIARALAPRPAVLMLDEPTVGVDQAGQEAFSALMRKIKDAFNVTLVIVSHDLRAVIHDCQRIACLNRTLHFHDAPEKLTPGLISEVFRCDLTGLFHSEHVGHEHDHSACGDGDRTSR